MKPIFRWIFIQMKEKKAATAAQLIGAWLVFNCMPVLKWDTSGNLIAYSYSIWGDWSAHFTFISNLLERGSHWLTQENPLFAGATFQYPFLSHALTAMTAWIFQSDVISSTYWSSLILLFFLPLCLQFLFQSAGLRARTALFATILFLFAGGLQVFDGPFFNGSLNPTEPVTNQFNAGSIFTQFIVFEFFPQRAFLFGLIFFSLVCGWILRILQKQHPSPTKVTVWLLLLPLSIFLHLHTWIAISTLTLFLFFFPSNTTLPRKKIFLFGSGLIILSAISLWCLLGRNQNQEFQMNQWDFWFPGWAQNSLANLPTATAMNPIWFWIYNTGFFLPLAIGGAAVLFRKQIKNSALFAFAGAGFFLFTIAWFFKLQPNFYDNLKTFTYSFLFLAPLGALAIEHFIETGTRFKFLKIILVGIILFIQSLSAFSDLNFIRTGHQSALMFSAEEISLAQEFKKIRSSPEAKVIINPIHNHWVPCLTGNPVMMGYPGWLWTWGIQYGKREQQIFSLLRGDANAQASFEALKPFEPEYIIVRQNEQLENRPINHEYLKSHFQLLLEKSGWEIYSIKSPTSSVR